MKNETNGADAAWLEAVFEQFEAPLVRYCARLVGDVDRGRDIVQDAFLRLCREPSDQRRDHVAAWLYTVCRNRALDIRKKEQRMNSLPYAKAQNAAASGDDPAVAAEQREAACDARAMLDRLPENQREVIRLKIEHGLSYREISAVTGLSVSNVGYLLHHGLQSLRKKLAHAQPDTENSR